MLKLVPQAAEPYPSFLEYLRERYGRNWVVARRTSRIVSRYGEDVHCFTQRTYDLERMKWSEGHPAYLLADSLPDCDDKTFILRAVLARLY